MSRRASELFGFALDRRCNKEDFLVERSFEDPLWLIYIVMIVVSLFSRIYKLTHSIQNWSRHNIYGIVQCGSETSLPRCQCFTIKITKTWRDWLTVWRKWNSTPNDFGCCVTLIVLWETTDNWVSYIWMSKVVNSLNLYFCKIFWLHQIAVNNFIILSRYIHIGNINCKNIDWSIVEKFLYEINYEYYLNWARDFYCILWCHQSTN